MKKKDYVIFLCISTIFAVLLFLKIGPSFNFFLYSVLIYVLATVAAIDFRTMTIPNKLVIIITVLAAASKAQVIKSIKLLFLYILRIAPLEEVLLSLSSAGSEIIYSIAGLILGGGLFFLIAAMTKGAMGGGDIKLMAALGFLLGAPKTALTVFLCFWIAAPVSLLLILIKIKTKKDFIPFGPFIALAAYISLIYGDELISQYLAWIYNL